MWTARGARARSHPERPPLTPPALALSLGPDRQGQTGRSLLVGRVVSIAQQEFSLPLERTHITDGVF